VRWWGWVLLALIIWGIAENPDGAAATAQHAGHVLNGAAAGMGTFLNKVFN
jgi:hypothetical protein